MKGFPGVHFHRKVGELFRSLQLSSFFFCHGERGEGGGGLEGLTVTYFFILS